MKLNVPPCETDPAPEDGHFREKLKGDVAAEAKIFSFVHHSHSATAKATKNLVMRDGLSYHRLAKKSLPAMLWAAAVRVKRRDEKGG
jgi:hypothetical protein